jgi:hypothetical protein
VTTPLGSHLLDMTPGSPGGFHEAAVLDDAPRRDYRRRLRQLDREIDDLRAAYRPEAAVRFRAERQDHPGRPGHRRGAPRDRPYWTVVLLPAGTSSGPG